MKKSIAFILSGIILGGAIFVLLFYYHTGSDSLSLQKIQALRELGEQWLIDNTKENGWFVYRYDPVTDTVPNSNNELRQLMASRLLAEMAMEENNLLALHKKNLGYIQNRFFVSSGDLARIEYERKSKLGAIAMAIRTYVASPLFAEYKLQAEQLAETILRLQTDTWLFRAWWKEPSYAYDEDYLLTFYSGEAIVALMELYHKTKNQKRLQAALRAQDAYLQRYVEEIDERYYPAYVPWHTISLRYLWQETNEPRYADAVFTLNDKLIDEMLHTDMKELKYVGRFYNPALANYGSPHSSSDAIYTEGLVYAYALAKAENDTWRMKTYRYALDLAVQNLIRLQYTPETVPPWIAPEKLLGAVRINAEDMSIRVDTTQHMIDALRAYEKLVK